ncbi:MAG TPA: PKD domain-containing protein [Gemmatales bacterium]|nr:PKD domain-containing protein [Gemmatales bacterium]
MALKDAAKEHVKTVAGKVGGGILGLVVAGGLMWFTPLVDRFIKPAKPLANFSTEEGDDTLSVTFKNLSQNAKQAKWDFGDGSPIEILNGTQAEVKHKFKKPGTYKVKLVVTNVVDQDDDRESQIAVGLKPQILDLSMKPINQKTKPYTAGVKIKFEATADLDAELEWDFGDGIYHKDKESVVHEFQLPGKQLVKVRAVMGHSKGSPSIQEVEVLPQSGLVTTGGVATPTVAANTKRHSPATLSVEVAVRSQLTADVLRMNRLKTVASSGKVTNGNLVVSIPVTPGYLIKAVRFEPTTLKKTGNVINESVMTSEDGKSVLVKAQLTKPGTDYNLNVGVAYVEEVDPATTKQSTVVLTLPGTSFLELPLGNKHTFEVKYQNQIVVNQSDLPIKAVEFTVEGRVFAVTTTKDAGQVKIMMREIPRQIRN